jgi:ABC-type Fe3+-siderophore transport system permease subunit
VDTTTIARQAAPDREPPVLRRTGRLALLVIGLGVLIALGAAVHLAQGTSSVTAWDVVRLVFGGGTDGSAAIVIESRLPRLLAAVAVGVALGASGAALQSVARNIMAAPDTLAVDAGAHLGIVAVAAFGISLPLLGATGVAFVSALGAATLVLVLAGTSGTGIVRLVLAGTAIAYAMVALTHIILLLFSNETRGLFAWGAGSLGQNGLGGVRTLGPVIAVALVLLLLLARRLDLIYLGDDHARTLGIHVGRIRAAAIVLGVLLAAAAVTLAGPIGFVGLAAPALIRLLANAVPGLHRHVALIPVAALTGVALLIGADVLLRAVIGSQGALEVPTGVITTILGVIFLVVLARNIRVSSATSEPPAAAARGGVSPLRFRLIITVLVVLAITTLVGSVLLGDTKLLMGDVVNWLTNQAGPIVTNVMSNRVPRVVAALLAGAALALAGTVIQAVARNPLAEPGIIGVSGGAGLGAVTVITLVPSVGFWTQAGFAGLGAAVAIAIVFLMAARGGFASERLVLIGFGVHAGSVALITLLITISDPWNETKALTWLGGSTYGRSFEHLVPMALVILLMVPVLVRARGELDLLSVDDETPRVLGVNVPRARLLMLTCAVLLTGSAVAGVGVIGFVGLVAPHAARVIVGRRHSRVLPVAALLGGILVCVADTIGRTVIAPAQLPAGLMTALIGAPYFVWLLFRSRLRTA